MLPYCLVSPIIKMYINPPSCVSGLLLHDSPYSQRNNPKYGASLFSLREARGRYKLKHNAQAWF